MGRKLMRVPLNFQWPYNKVWEGYLRPFCKPAHRCPDCEGSGYSPQALELQKQWYGNSRKPFDPVSKGSAPYTPDTPEVWAFAARNVSRGEGYYGKATDANIRREALRLCSFWNNQWSHHLAQRDVQALVDAGRLMDFTHKLTPGEGWTAILPVPEITAAQVNAWSLSGMGHCGIDCHIVISAEVERQGLSSACPHCDGHGEVWDSPEAKASAESWQRTPPPAGDGYQLWETTSEGSPISPVFGTSQELASWLTSNPHGRDDGVSFEQWMSFIEGPGWAPTFVSCGNQLVSGVLASSSAKK